MNQRPFIIFLAWLALTSASIARATTPDPIMTDDLRRQCYDILTRAIDDAPQWVRLHAAEALVSLKHPAPALAAFRPLSETTEPQYRIVVWRVLAAAEPDAAERQRYVARIRSALLDSAGPDRTHAMESLAKLHEPPLDEPERQHIHTIADGAGPASPFALWRLAQANDATALDQLVRLLSANDPTTRARAAYVLGRLHRPPATAALSRALSHEPADSPAHSMMRAAAGGDTVRELAHDPRVPPSGRYAAAMWFAEFGTASDAVLLAPLLHDPDRDVQVAFAFALLEIDRHATAPANRLP